MPSTEHKPVCDLSDVSTGDAFRLMWRVTAALHAAGLRERAAEYWVRAYQLRDGRKAINVAREYVEISQPCTGCGKPLTEATAAKIGKRTLTICRACHYARIAQGRQRQLAADGALLQAREVAT